MATKQSSANVGTSRKGSGEYQTATTPAGGSAHVTVSFDDTVITNKDQLMAACKMIADQFFQR